MNYKISSHNSMNAAIVAIDNGSYINSKGIDPIIFYGFWILPTPFMCYKLVIVIK